MGVTVGSAGVGSSHSYWVVVSGRAVVVFLSTDGSVGTIPRASAVTVVSLGVSPGTIHCHVAC